MNASPPALNGPHLVIVFPQDKSPRELVNLASGLERSLANACGQAPLLVRPDTSALCLLAHGSLAGITRAVDEVTDAYSRWIVLPVDGPHTARGLSSADQWLLRNS